MSRIYDVIIIGGGPAGYSAALYSARAGLSTCVLERISAGGQMALTDIIDNYPGFDEGVDGFTLGMKMQQGAERFDAKTEYAEVNAVDFNDKTKRIITTNGEYMAKTVIIASGANPRKLGIAKEDDFVGRGIHYCAHCDGRFYKDKTVMVIGGGNSAVSDALYLSRIAKKVYLVHRRDTLRATKIYHEPLIKANNVEFLWNSTVEDFIVQDRVNGAIIKNIKTNDFYDIVCDGIFISIGRVPETSFLGDAVDYDSNGYIIADETTKTSAQGVFAVGDVRTKALRQVVTAAADGAVAAHFAEEYISQLK